VRWRKVWTEARFGSQRGLLVASYPGPWVSLGVHLHVWPPREAQLNIHAGWWLIIIGRHYDAGPGPRE
jgi:hypothetical protein